MFESFVGAKVSKRGKRRNVIVAASAGVHAVAVLGLLVHGFWEIERLGMPKRDITLVAAAALPPPPPAPAPSAKKPPDRKVVRVRPQEATQPVARAVDEAVEIELVTEEPGVPGGVAGGSGAGLHGISISSDRPALPGPVIVTPPPAPARHVPEVVEATRVEAQRIAGTMYVQPDDATKLQMARDQRRRARATVRMCLSARGEVASTRIVRSSGYPDYDARLLAAMQGWRYRPYLVNGQAAPVCTHVTFIYDQR